MAFTLGLLLCAFACGAWAQQCTSEGQLTADNNDATCSRYRECYRGQYYPTQCVTGQIFHPGLNQCVLQNSYDCRCDAPSCVRPDCSGHNNQDIADKQNCSRYVYCNGQYPLRRDCAQGSVFNPNAATCEPRSTTKYVCPNDPFQCPTASGIYEDRSDPNCQTYVQCNNYVATKNRCQGDWHYYGRLGRCVLSDSYDCHDPNPFVCPERDRDFPDSRDPHKYYYCQGDVPLHRTCPSGQNFNSRDDVRRCT